MDLKLKPTGLVCLLAVACALGACGSTEDVEGTDGARQEALAQLEAALDALNAKRAMLDEIETEMAADPTEAEEGAPAVDVEAMTAEARRLGKEIDSETLDLGRMIVDFINADAPLVGEPMSETQRAAIRMKSEEDILVAQEFIDKGGDYRRAIRIYRDALAIDADNRRVKELLELAETLRFMDEERFAQIKKGMSDSEVRELLGAPVHQNVRKYEDRGVTAWFYPKGEDRSAAAVWFRERKKDGVQEVYKVDFNAIEVQSDEEG